MAKAPYTPNSTLTSRSVLPGIIEAKRRGHHPLEIPMSSDISEWWESLYNASKGDGKIWWNRYVSSERTFRLQVEKFLQNGAISDIASMVAGEALPYLQRTAAPSLAEFTAAGWEHWHAPTPGWSGTSPTMRVGKAFGVLGASVRAKVNLKMKDLPEAHAAWAAAMSWSAIPIKVGKHRLIHPHCMHAVAALRKLFEANFAAKLMTDDMDLVMQRLRPRILDECIRYANDPTFPMDNSAEIMKDFAEPTVRYFIETRNFRKNWRLSRTTPDEMDPGDNRVAGASLAWAITRMHVARCLEETIRIRQSLSALSFCCDARKRGSERAKPANALSPTINHLKVFIMRPHRILPEGNSPYLEEVERFYAEIVSVVKPLCSKTSSLEQWDAALKFFIDNQWRFDSRMVAKVARDEALEYFRKVKAGEAGGVIPIEEWCWDSRVYRGEVGAEYGHWKHAASEFGQSWMAFGDMDRDLDKETSESLPFLKIHEGRSFSAGVTSINLSDETDEIEVGAETEEEKEA